MEKASDKNFSLFVQAKKTFFVFSGFFVFFFSLLLLAQLLNFVGQTITFLLQDKFLTLSLSPSSLTLNSSLSVNKEANFVLTTKGDSLEISKLALKAPIVKARSTDLKYLSQDLNEGTVMYPGSSLPGQAGQLLILGHSAPSFWPKIRFDWVFSNLNDLQDGDEILVNLEQKQYRYRVSRKLFLDKGEPLPQNDPATSHRLYLITCWPPGRDFKRLAVEAVLTDK